MRWQAEEQHLQDYNQLDKKTLKAHRGCVAFPPRLTTAIFTSRRNVIHTQTINRPFLFEWAFGALSEHNGFETHKQSINQYDCGCEVSWGSFSFPLGAKLQRTQQLTRFPTPERTVRWIFFDRGTSCHRTLLASVFVENIPRIMLVAWRVVKDSSPELKFELSDISCTLQPYRARVLILYQIKQSCSEKVLVDGK